VGAQLRRLAEGDESLLQLLILRVGLTQLELQVGRGGRQGQRVAKLDDRLRILLLVHVSLGAGLEFGLPRGLACAASRNQRGQRQQRQAGIGARLLHLHDGSLLEIEFGESRSRPVAGRSWNSSRSAPAPKPAWIARYTAGDRRPCRAPCRHPSANAAAAIAPAYIANPAALSRRQVPWPSASAASPVGSHRSQSVGSHCAALLALGCLRISRTRPRP